jgi:hypothetical protein
MMPTVKAFAQPKAGRSKVTGISRGETDKTDKTEFCQFCQ